MEPKHIPLTAAHIAILEKRGIGEIATTLGWQTCASRKGDWIAIPYYRAGKLVNWKYRTIAGEKQFSQTTGGEQCFYNLETIEVMAAMSPAELANMPVIITEGEMDCAIALQCGYDSISVPNGAPAKEIDSEDSVKFDFLKDFPKFAVAVLAVDDDPAGIILRQELALRLGWHRCKWVQYPKECKDLNDVFVKYGQKGIDVVLKQKAKFMNSGGLFLMSEIPEQAEMPAYECGIGNVSDMVKPRFGDLMIVTGIPSMGKSLFTNCMACNMARDHGWKVSFGSFEQNPRGDHLRYLRTYYLGKPSKDYAGNWNWSDTEMAAADRWIDQHFTFIVPDVNSDDMINLKWLLARVRAAITQYGANMIIIDPWNEIDHDRPNGMTLTEYTGFAIKEFKRIARQYMVFIVIVAHPSKMEKSKDGSYGIPSLYDISDSAHWANKSDLGVVIHRLEGEGPTKYATLVRVAKVRYWGVIGRTGDRFLEYLPDTGKYLDAPDFQPKRPRDYSKAVTEKQDKKKPGDDKQNPLFEK